MGQEGFKLIHTSLRVMLRPANHCRKNFRLAAGDGEMKANRLNNISSQHCVRKIILVKSESENPREEL